MEKGVFAVDDLPNSILKGIYKYWLDLKGDRAMPSRSDLNPADIVSLLPNIVLVDVEAETGRYKYRLVGTETVKALGVDSTGRYLDEFPYVERAMKKRYDWLVKEKRPYLYFDKLRWASKSYMDYYALGLPLSSNGRDVNILMFGVHFQFPSDLRPKSFSLGF